MCGGQSAPLKNPVVTLTTIFQQCILKSVYKTRVAKQKRSIVGERTEEEMSMQEQFFSPK